MIVVIFVTQNNFSNAPGISDCFLRFYQSCHSINAQQRVRRICRHSFSHDMFADDIYIELYKSESASEAFTLVGTINFCIPDVKVWIVQNKLQLNDDKTENLMIGSAPGICCLPWCYPRP